MKRTLVELKMKPSPARTVMTNSSLLLLSKNSSLRKVLKINQVDARHAKMLKKRE
jgi:hypothetical protein